jgi:hypothetical protein
MTAIRRFDILSVGVTLGVLYAVIGLLGGALFSLFAVVAGGMASRSETQLPPFFGMLFGVGAVIVFPIIYGMIGLVFGMIAAAVYNVVARLTGGIKIELG